MPPNPDNIIAHAPAPITNKITDRITNLRPGFTGWLFTVATIIMIIPTMNMMATAAQYNKRSAIIITALI